MAVISTRDDGRMEGQKIEKSCLIQAGNHDAVGEVLTNVRGVAVAVAARVQCSDIIYFLGVPA